MNYYNILLNCFGKIIVNLFVSNFDKSFCLVNVIFNCLLFEVYFLKLENFLKLVWYCY